MAPRLPANRNSLRKTRYTFRKPLLRLPSKQSNRIADVRNRYETFYVSRRAPNAANSESTNVSPSEDLCNPWNFPKRRSSLVSLIPDSHTEHMRKLQSAFDKLLKEYPCSRLFLPNKRVAHLSGGYTKVSTCKVLRCGLEFKLTQCEAESLKKRLTAAAEENMYNRDAENKKKI